MTVTAAVPFGTLIRTRRQAKGLTQAHVAALLDVTKSYLCHVEANRREPGPGFRTNILTILDLTDDAAYALAATSGADLLRTRDSLTHRIHEADRWVSGQGVPPDARGLRAQRDLITAELLRRLGEQP